MSKIRLSLKRTYGTYREEVREQMGTVVNDEESFCLAGLLSDVMPFNLGENIHSLMTAVILLTDPLSACDELKPHWYWPALELLFELNRVKDDKEDEEEETTVDEEENEYATDEIIDLAATLSELAIRVIKRDSRAGGPKELS